MTGKRGNWAARYESYEGKSFKLVPYEHATVAYGYDKNGIWIMDVGDGKRYYYGWSNFIARWMYGVLRLCMPTCTTRLFRRAASIISRPSRRLWLAGFST